MKQASFMSSIIQAGGKRRDGTTEALNTDVQVPLSLGTIECSGASIYINKIRQLRHPIPDKMLLPFVMKLTVARAASPDDHRAVRSPKMSASSGTPGSHGSGFSILPRGTAVRILPHAGN